jgi:hypothetical protein
MERKYKNIIIIGIILLINILFAYKYLGRYTNNVVLIMIPLVLFYFFVLKGLRFNLSKRTSFIITLIALVGFVAFSLIILDKISLDTLKVDRWSIISEFWNFAFQNKYPYYAKSFDGNPPGPMPIYFIIALPFYLIGELGYIPITGILLFIVLLHLNKVSGQKLIAAVVISIGSVFCLWEIVTRSNIFFNSVLVLLVLGNFIKLGKKQKIRFYFNAVIAGLLLSTRSFFIIPYIVFFVGIAIRKEISIKMLLGYVVIGFTSFIVSFLPLVLFFLDDFFYDESFLCSIFLFYSKDLYNWFYYTCLGIFVNFKIET